MRPPGSVPRAVWIGIVVGLVLLIVGLPLGLHRASVATSRAGAAATSSSAAPTSAVPTSAAASSSAASSATSATATTTAAASTSAAQLRVLVIGDGFTSGSTDGGVSGKGWPELLQAQLRADGRAVTIDVAAALGSGYLTGADDDGTFGAMTDAASTGYDVVVYFGSTNDEQVSGDLTAAAEQAYTSALKASPGAGLLVIGPASLAADTAADRAVRDDVHTAAEDADAVWLDPLADDWFPTDEPDLVGPSGLHPDDAGHARMAELIGPSLEELLDGGTAAASSAAG